MGEPGCAFESWGDWSASSTLAGQRAIAPVFHERINYVFLKSFKFKCLLNLVQARSPVATHVKFKVFKFIVFNLHQIEMSLKTLCERGPQWRRKWGRWKLSAGGRQPSLQGPSTAEKSFLSFGFIFLQGPSTGRKSLLVSYEDNYPSELTAGSVLVLSFLYRKRSGE